MANDTVTMPATKSKAPPVPTVLTTAGIRRGGRWQQVFVPVKNQPGELLLLDKTRLRIDTQYQRKLWPMRVARMAANWSWVSCGALIVSRRHRGEDFFIIDGQHRWEAAKMIKAIKSLPCLCFELDQIRDEAVGFLAANTERKLPSLAEQFKALLIAEDQTAVTARRLALSAGRHISAPSSPTTISCVAEFMRLIQVDAPAVERAFPALAKLCEGRPLLSRLLRGVVTLERRMPAGASLGDKRWLERLERVGFDQVVQNIKTLTSIENNGSERTCAEGVLRAINRNLRDPLQVDLNRTR